MINLNDKYFNLVEQVRGKAPFEPEIAVVLGSGLGDFAKSVDTLVSIPTSEIQNYPLSTVSGHKGYIHFAQSGGKNLILYQGRIHFYEGYKISECILPVHIAAKLGCSRLLLTNAAGGINPNFIPGDLMLISSVNSINIKKEITSIIGLPTTERKNSFINFPSPALNNIIKDAAIDEKIDLKEGVYWFSKGPSYETPAEIKMMSVFNADSVGMSTVHEAIYGAFLGLSVSAISCITNYAAGISPHKLNHKEVMETADLVKGKFERLVKKAIDLM